jgi:hypothetical protein
MLLPERKVRTAFIRWKFPVKFLRVMAATEYRSSANAILLVELHQQRAKLQKAHNRMICNAGILNEERLSQPRCRRWLTFLIAALLGMTVQFARIFNDF